MLAQLFQAWRGAAPEDAGVVAAAASGLVLVGTLFVKNLWLQFLRYDNVAAFVRLKRCGGQWAASA